MLGPRLGLFLLAILPVEDARDGEQEQHDGADDDPAITLGALGHLVAAKILVDFADEAVGSIWGKRQKNLLCRRGSASRHALIPRPG